MSDYATWGEIPNTLATKATLRRQGLRPAKGQKPAGRKIGGYGPYNLYVVADAVPVRQPSDAQIKALKKARELIGTFICSCCGERKEQTGAQYGLCCDCELQKAAEEEASFLGEARGEATAWAQQILAEGFVLLDTETTGLDTNAEIVQMAIIDASGAVLLDSLVLPSYFPESYREAERIHGISRERLTGAPTILDLWPQILAILDGAPNIVVYNADFDFRLLSQSLAARGVRLYQPNWRIHCAMEMYAQWWGEYSDFHGSFRWQRLVGGDHTALGDCRATLERIKVMAQ